MEQTDLISRLTFETTSCTFNTELSTDEGSTFYVQKLKSDAPMLDELAYLKNDYELCKKLNCNGVLKSIKMIKKDGSHVVYKEHFDGIPLSRYLYTWEFNILQFLDLATKLTIILKQLHEQQIVVKDFVIENILIDPQSNEIKLCSLGSASELKRETVQINSNMHLGSLWHIAPEQTGRIGRSIDYRSDFYALGVILYQIACNTKPFNFSDTLELIHAHIAKQPVEPKILQPKVPNAINQLILKLMAKNVEDRYQSEAGILKDLEYCKKNWQEKGNIDHFELAQSDFSNIFCLSEKLYGRSNELNRLTEGWQSVQNQVNKLYLVSGFSGIGKTRLIHEIRGIIFENKGIFTSGKFDQLNKETSYSAIIEALKSMVQNILSEPADQLEKWKDIMMTSTDDDIAFLCDFLPEINSLLPEKVETINVGPVEGQKRFRKSVIDFLSIFEKNNKSLTIFIDDLQWSDNASLELLQEILESELKNIFIIGAYRDNEVNPSHKLTVTINSLKEVIPDRLSEIHLDALPSEDINHFLADSLNRMPEDTKSLTELVIKKTMGNPFFIKEFLQQLVEDEIVHFDDKKHEWIWDTEEIKKAKISDYVVELLLKRMSKLSAEAQDAISLAACIGSTFDFNTLSIISGKDVSTLSEIIWELASQDYINALGNWGKFHSSELWSNIDSIDDRNFKFKFQHDRIQQAAYSIIPSDHQKEKHYQIGQLLYAQLSDDEVDKSVFDIINHFLIGKDHITSPTERERIAKLSHQAGDKALRNNVIEPAYNYFSLGMDLLDGNQSKDLFKDLLIGRSECAYLMGNYEKSEELFDRAVENATTNLNKAEILSRKMALYEDTQRHAMAIDAAREALKLLDVKLPEKTTQLHVMTELVKVKYLLRGKSIEQLLNNKPMESPKMIVIMKTLMNLWGPAYLLQKQELLAFKILRMVNYSIRYGNSIESALAYAFYGYVISAQMKDYDQGCEFANLGLALNEKLGDESLRSKVIVIAEGCVAHWNRPYASMLEKLKTAFKVGIESNDIIYAGYATTFMNRNHFFSGKNLRQVMIDAKGFLKFVTNVDAEISRQQMLPWCRIILKLMGKEPTEDIFGDLVDEKDHFEFISAMNTEMNVQLPLAQYHTMNCIYHYFMNEDELAYSEAVKADPFMTSVPGLVEWSEQIVFKTLAGIDLLQKGKSLSSKETRSIKKHLNLMKKWSVCAPENFKAKYLIAKGEFAKYQGQLDLAETSLKEAILAAEDANMIQIAGLAFERLGKLHREQNQTKEAESMFRKACIAFHDWGAFHKVESLQKRMKTMGYQTGLSDTHQSNIDSKNIDLQSILSAAQTLSGEIKPDKLMDKLLLILIKNAGAQNAYLIRNVKNILQVDASSQMVNKHVHVKHNCPIEDLDGLAHGIIRKSFNAKEPIILNDVEYEKSISSIIPKSLNAKSILTLPILSKDQVIAIIYLDNHLSKDVFTNNRIELLRMLSSQIAISIENAELYQSLEDRVMERTRTIEEQKLELEKSKRKSEDLLANILPSEIATELKNIGSCKPRRYDSVTIMFTDFEQFTRMSEKLTPEELVETVDYQYKIFDNIVEKYGIEKIKTIGDSYMCAAGLPKTDKDHALKAVNAAIEIAEFVESFVEQRKAADLPYCRMRIGLHTGPVIAGVVGNKKFAYDIWGDSVNTASRMESASEVGKVNISNTTYTLVKDHFECTYRGKIQAKNKGEIEMYYVAKSKK